MANLTPGPSPWRRGEQIIKSTHMSKLTPFLWYDNQAEEAVNYYLGIFKHSKIRQVHRYGEAGPMPAGTVLTIDFELDGQSFVALNGGPMYKFTEAVSFVIDCETQEEVNHYWNNLTAGGEEQPCGWLKDKFGLSWQVVPRILLELLSHPDPAVAQRVMMAMFKMKKIDIAVLLEARDRES